MKIIKISAAVVMLIGSGIALSACADGYGRGPEYSRVSVGVSASDYDRRDGDRDHDGVPNRYDRDRDGDGVPNRYDDAPNNPRHR